MAMHLRMRLEETLILNAIVIKPGNIYLFLPTRTWEHQPTAKFPSLFLLSCAAAVPKTEILKAACGSNAITFLSPMTCGETKLYASALQMQLKNSSKKEIQNARYEFRRSISIAGHCFSDYVVSSGYFPQSFLKPEMMSFENFNFQLSVDGARRIEFRESSDQSSHELRQN